MDKIGAYSAYQKSYADSVKSWKKEEVKKTAEREDAVKRKETDKVSGKEKVTLSSRAKELLKELQKKYGNMDFIIADYESDEEASALLARGTKEFSVLIEPDILEQMAADEEVKTKYMGLIEESVGQMTGLKEKLEESGEEVTRFGISIADDGTVSFFAELEKMSEKQRERIENARESAKQERKENAETTLEKHRKAFVQASTIEELLEKVKAIDWDKVEEKTAEFSGNRIDFSV